MWSYGRFLYCSPHCWAPENNIWRKTDVNKSWTSSCSSLSSSSSPSLIRGSSKRRTRSSCSWASSPPTATSWAAGSGGLAPGEMAQVQRMRIFYTKGKYLEASTNTRTLFDDFSSKLRKTFENFFSPMGTCLRQSPGTWLLGKLDKNLGEGKEGKYWCRILSFCCTSISSGPWY